MQIELKLPYAECYNFEYPQKRKRKEKLSDYVKNELTGTHPGFSEESLWDYRTIKNDDKKLIISAVLDRDFYLEMRLTKNGSDFYTKTSKGKVVSLFKKNCFNEKGERKKYRKYIIILAAVLILPLPFLYARTFKEESFSEVQEISVVEKEEDVFNAFDILNGCSAVIEKYEGKIKMFQLAIKGKSFLIFSLNGCEPYSLIRELEKEENILQCRCENIIYSEGKETYEIKIDLRSLSVIPKQISQIDLLQIQNIVTQELQAQKVKLVSSGVENGSNLITVQMECTGEELGRINEEINEICLREKLFITELSETKSDGEDRYFIKVEFLCLDGKQRIVTVNTEEMISKIFEKEDFSLVKENTVVKKQTAEELNIHKNLKKIGMINKEGNTLYYYRSEDGKIEISEVDYE